MDVADILRKYGLDAPPTHDEFIRQLHALPTYDRNWLYSPVPPPRTLLQGDVIGPVRYPATSEDNEICILEGNVMLISNTCDLVPRQSSFSLIAPVTEMAIYTRPEGETDESWLNHLNSVRKFEVDSYYYLPSWAANEDSFADFSRMMHLPSTYLEGVFAAEANRRAVSLSTKGHLLLLSKLAYFLVRLESQEIVRRTEN